MAVLLVMVFELATRLGEFGVCSFARRQILMNLLIAALPGAKLGFFLIAALPDGKAWRIYNLQLCLAEKLGELAYCNFCRQQSLTNLLIAALVDGKTWRIS